MICLHKWTTNDNEIEMKLILMSRKPKRLMGLQVYHDDFKNAI